MDNHRDNKTYSIENLLASGETPESIYQSALNIVKKNNEQEQRNKEIAKKRKTALDAFRDYLDAVNEKPISNAFMKKLEEEFIQIERGARSEKPETRERRKNLRGEPLDPEFEKFLRDMGFLDD